MDEATSDVVKGRLEIMAVLGFGRRKFYQLRDAIPMKHDGYCWRASRAALLAWHRDFTSGKAA